jgi:hypothetical protein
MLFVIALGASLCACIHAPANQGATKERPEMPTIESGAYPAQQKLSAENVLSKVLDIIRNSRSIEDFTPEKISEVMGVGMTTYDQTRFGAGAALTPDWWYTLEMDSATIRGPQFMFGFHPDNPRKSPPATDICRMDFERFSSELEGMGLKKQTNYGEHGRIVDYKFESPHLLVSVGTEGEDNAPPEKAAHQCVRTVTIS